MKYLILKKETVLVKNPKYRVLNDGSIVDASEPPVLNEYRYSIAEFSSTVELVKFFDTLSPEEINNCVRYDVSAKYECEPITAVTYKEASLV